MTKPFARAELSVSLNMGRVRPLRVAFIRCPEQFCCPTQAIICRILTIEPLEPDLTMRPRLLLGDMAFCAMSPIESRV